MYQSFYVNFSEIRIKTLSELFDIFFFPVYLFSSSYILDKFFWLLFILKQTRSLSWAWNIVFHFFFFFCWMHLTLWINKDNRMIFFSLINVRCIRHEILYCHCLYLSSSSFVVCSCVCVWVWSFFLRKKHNWKKKTTLCDAYWLNKFFLTNEKKLMILRYLLTSTDLIHYCL